MVTASDIQESLIQFRDDTQARILQRYFQTFPGGYGEGDIFLGLRVPQIRKIVHEARLQVPFPDIHSLLLSPIHEDRSAGFLLLVEEMNAALPRRHEPPTAHADRRHEIATFYLAHATHANNWDLVDTSCPTIIGQLLLLHAPDGNPHSRQLLHTLAQSSNIWEQRIAIVSNLTLIRHNDTSTFLQIADSLLAHPHDLIHKAIGWMLREVGKVDKLLLTSYLDSHLPHLPRVTLRYAIERLSPSERSYYLHKH